MRNACTISQSGNAMESLIVSSHKGKCDDRSDSELDHSQIFHNQRIRTMKNDLTFDSVFKYFRNIQQNRRRFQLRWRFLKKYLSIDILIVIVLHYNQHCFLSLNGYISFSLSRVGSSIIPLPSCNLQSSILSKNRKKDRGTNN